MYNGWVHFDDPAYYKQQFFVTTLGGVHVFTKIDYCHIPNYALVLDLIVLRLFMVWMIKM